MGDNPPSAAFDFSVVNEGETNARVIEWSIKTFNMLATDHLPPVPDYERPDGKGPLDNLTLAKAEHYPHQEPAPHLAHFGAINSAFPRAYKLVLLGFIRYEDEVNNKYMLGFCYAKESQSDRFGEIGGHDYNYSC